MSRRVQAKSLISKRNRAAYCRKIGWRCNTSLVVVLVPIEHDAVMTELETTFEEAMTCGNSYKFSFNITVYCVPFKDFDFSYGK